MAKQKLGGKHRHAAKVAAKVQAAVEGQTGPAPPAHTKRKIARKIGFLDRIAASNAASLKTRHGVQKHKGKSKVLRSALPDLAALGESLAELGNQKQMAHRGRLGHSLKGAKGRQAISGQEIARISKVLHHPTYQANPMEAIKHHLAAAAAASTKVAKPGGTAKPSGTAKASSTATLSGAAIPSSTAAPSGPAKARGRPVAGRGRPGAPPQRNGAAASLSRTVKPGVSKRKGGSPGGRGRGGGPRSGASAR